uniref:Uncharacterized protein n=1 Tax=Anopheles culicifacies TaxID=139723 RepID=A0A182M0C9_9DIPT
MVFRLLIALLLIDVCLGQYEYPNYEEEASANTPESYPNPDYGTNPEPNPDPNPEPQYPDYSYVERVETTTAATTTTMHTPRSKRPQVFPPTPTVRPSRRRLNRIMEYYFLDDQGFPIRAAVRRRYLRGSQTNWVLPYYRSILSGARSTRSNGARGRAQRIEFWWFLFRTVAGSSTRTTTLGRVCDVPVIDSGYRRFNIAASPEFEITFKKALQAIKPSVWFAVCKMIEIRTAYFVVLLFLVTLSGQTVVAQESEYEYYYEEVNASASTDAPNDSSSIAIETTTVTLVQEAEPTTETVTPPIVDSDYIKKPSDVKQTSEVIVEESTDDILGRNDLSTAAFEELKPIATTDVRRTDIILTQQNGTRPTKYHTTLSKNISTPKAHTKPEIVLNIYTGMYGMHSMGMNRPSGNRGNGRNNFWPRAQPSMQGWYGMYGMHNRNPMQSYMPRQNPPVYRGRGQQGGYDDAYNSFTYNTATNPRRNSQQNRGTALDQQASMAVFNFLLQALGQRSGSSTRSQSQVQQGSRRRQ